MQADLPSAQQNIRTVLSAYPHDAAVAVSPAAERKLQQLRRADQIAYLDAAATASIVVTASAADSTADDSSSSSSKVAAAVVEEVSSSVLQQYGSTGVLAALTCAVALKPPRWVFPIADRVSCTALAAVISKPTAAGGAGHHSSHHGGKSSNSRGSHAAASAGSALGWGLDAKARAAQGAAAGVLRDCLLLKPGSRVEDVYWVLKRPPYGLLEGDFVRAECRVLHAGSRTAGMTGDSARGQEAVQDTPGHESSAGQEQHERHGLGTKVQCRVVRKDELVGPSNCVLLLQTNRKVSWQATAAGRKHH